MVSTRDLPALIVQEEAHHDLVIVASSTNRVFVRDKSSLRTVTIQKACRLGDESFKSFAIFPNNKNGNIATSRTKSSEAMKKNRFSTTAGAIVTVIGFLCQFIGLLALH